MMQTQLFLCEVQVGDITHGEPEEAAEAKQQCHEPEGMLEEAWDDVNNCRLDPAKVSEARRAEMEFFRNMKVYTKLPLQRCKDMTGKPPIQVRWIDTNQ